MRSLCVLLVAVSLPIRAHARQPVPEPPVRIVTVTDTLDGAVGGVSVDALGYVYVADFGEKVWRISPWGDVQVHAAGLYGASGNAIDSHGRLLQSNFFGNFVTRISRTGEMEPLATGLQGPVGIAVGPGDSLTVTNCSGNTLSRIAPDGRVSTFASSPLFNCPNSIARRPDDGFVVANFSDGRVLSVSAEGMVSEHVVIPGGGNGHLTYAAGELFVTSLRGNRIYRVDAEGGVHVFAGDGRLVSLDAESGDAASFSTPNGIAYDARRDVLYTNDYLLPWLRRGVDRPRSLLRRIELPSLSTRFDHALAQGGVTAAIDAYRDYRKTRAGRFTELEVNALGYAHLRAGGIEAALALFRLNTEDYPRSANTWDSFAEALEAAGRTEEAIANYRKSLELNPANTNAIEMIRRLGGR